MTPSPDDIFFSVIIPAYNEQEAIEGTCQAIVDRFAAEGIDDYEILVVLDQSTDDTEAALKRAVSRLARVRYIHQQPVRGFGYGIRCGLEHFRGQYACIVMADLSDSPADIVTYYRKAKEGAECVFGSRFVRGGRLVEYPRGKRVFNRLANWFIKGLFWIGYDDYTNAFKCYRRDVIEGISPLLARRFNMTVEMPLKAIVRGYRYVTVPITWTNRAVGESKLRVGAVGGRYLMTVLQIFLERWLSKGDYRRPGGK